MKIKLTFSEAIFYCALFFFITGNFFKQITTVNNSKLLFSIMTGLVMIALVLTVIKVMFDARYHLIRLIVSSILGIFFISIAIITNNLMIPVATFCFCVAMNNVPFKRVVYVCMCLLIIHMLITHALLLLNVIENSHDYRIDGKIRYDLGYKFITLSSNFIFHILVMYFYVRQEKIKWFEIGILTLITLYFYKLTDTKSALLFSLLTLSVMIIFKIGHRYFQTKNRLWKWLVKSSVFVCASLSIILTVLYRPNNNLLTQLNALLSERLELGQQALSLYPVKLLGQPIDWIFYGSDAQIIDGERIHYMYVDSSFINILLNYGIFMLAFIVIGYFILGNRKQFQNGYFSIALVIIAVHSIFDPQFLEIIYNPFLLSLGYLFSPIIEQQERNVKTLI